MSAKSAPASTQALRSTIHPLSTKCGLQVSALCLGGATFTYRHPEPSSAPPPSAPGLPTSSPEETVALLDAFVEAGGNFIDTSDVYGGSDSERAIGAWLKGKGPAFRSKVVIATKYGRPTGDGAQDVGSSRSHILQAVEASLQRLQTSYIDLYQQHVWFDSTPIEETLQALNDLVRQGKVRYIGCSNFSAYQLARASAFTAQHGLSGFVSLQAQYSLLARMLDWEHLHACQQDGIGLLCYQPLACGWLSGKYTRDTAQQKDTGTRVGWANATFKGGAVKQQVDLESEETWAVLDEVTAIAAELGQPVAAVAIRWLLQRPAVSSVIIGARTVAQLTDNLKAVNFTLSAEQMQRLNAVSKRSWPYPFNVTAEFSKRDQ